MALRDYPKVDKAAINCSQAENKFQSFFQEVNGFICRSNHPDKGCDFTIELVDSHHALNWHFQIQLKSMENTKVVEDKLVAHPIETSRLGYLLRNNPPIGLIALYSEKDGSIYYDFIEEIYKRIMDRHNSRDWEGQDTVTIHIPTAKVLSLSSLQDIHSKVLQVHRNLQQLVKSKGGNYGLPVIDIEPTAKIDFNDLKTVKKLLCDFGFSFLFNFQLGRAKELLNKFSYADLRGDQQLSLVAAAIYCDSGSHHESSYFIEILRRHESFVVANKNIIDWISLKNDQFLGKISSVEYVSRATDIKSLIEGDLQRATIEVHIILQMLYQVKPFENIPHLIFERIKSLFELLDRLKGDEFQVDYIYSLNLENYAFLVTLQRQQQLSYYDLSKSLGAELSLAVRCQTAMQVLSEHQLLLQQIADRCDKAIKYRNFLVAAVCLLTKLRYFLNFELDQIYYQSTELGKDKMQDDELLADLIEISSKVSNIFQERGYDRQAYECLCHSMEFIYISRNRPGFKDSYDTNSLLSNMRRLEQEMRMPPYELLVEEAEKIRTTKGKESNDKSYLVGLDDEQLHNLARHSLKIWRLPDACCVNIYNELKSYKLFYTRCANKDIEVRRRPHPSGNIAFEYRDPTSFVLYNKKSGIVSTFSRDMDVLLKSWGY